MRRHVLNVLCALSLFVALATAGIWARSYAVRDIVTIDGDTFLITLSEGGSLTRTGFPALSADPPDVPTTVGWESEPLRGFNVIRGLTDFQFRSTANDPSGRVLVFPHWVAVALFALAPVARFVLWLRRREGAAAAAFPIEPAAASPPP